jgi:hypothetical protein
MHTPPSAAGTLGATGIPGGWCHNKRERQHRMSSGATCKSVCQSGSTPAQRPWLSSCSQWPHTRAARPSICWPSAGHIGCRTSTPSNPHQPHPTPARPPHSHAPPRWLCAAPPASAHLPLLPVLQELDPAGGPQDGGVAAQVHEHIQAVIRRAAHNGAGHVLAAPVVPPRLLGQPTAGPGQAVALRLLVVVDGHAVGVAVRHPALLLPGRPGLDERAAAAAAGVTRRVGCCLPVHLQPHTTQSASSRTGCQVQAPAAATTGAGTHGGAGCPAGQAGVWGTAHSAVSCAALADEGRRYGADAVHVLRSSHAPSTLAGMPGSPGHHQRRHPAAGTGGRCQQRRPGVHCWAGQAAAPPAGHPGCGTPPGGPLHHHLLTTGHSSSTVCDDAIQQSSKEQCTSTCEQLQQQPTVLPWKLIRPSQWLISLLLCDCPCRGIAPTSQRRQPQASPPPTRVVCLCWLVLPRPQPVLQRCCHKALVLQQHVTAATPQAPMNALLPFAPHSVQQPPQDVSAVCALRRRQQQLASSCGTCCLPRLWPLAAWWRWL